MICLETPRLHLLTPGDKDAPRLLAYYQKNQAHFAPWEPLRPASFYQIDYWHKCLGEFEAQDQSSIARRFILLNRTAPDGPVVGHCNFTQMTLGIFHACYLGYSLDVDFVGQGLMGEALKVAIAHVFNELQLHRIMANYMPTNERSGRLLRHLGFTVEGYARDYLFIAGAWRDHILTSLTNSQLTQLPH